jgi:hypothetical protein
MEPAKTKWIRHVIIGIVLSGLVLLAGIAVGRGLALAMRTTHLVNDHSWRCESHEPALPQSGCTPGLAVARPSTYGMASST